MAQWLVKTEGKLIFIRKKSNYENVVVRRRGGNAFCMRSLAGCVLCRCGRAGQVAQVVGRSDEWCQNPPDSAGDGGSGLTPVTSLQLLPGQEMPASLNQPKTITQDRL